MNIIFEISAKNCISANIFQQKKIFMKTHPYSPSVSFFRNFSCRGVGVGFCEIFFLLEDICTNAVFCADFKYDIHFVLKSRYNDKNDTTLKLSSPI